MRLVESNYLYENENLVCSLKKVLDLKIIIYIKEDYNFIFILIFILNLSSKTIKF